MVNKKQCIVIFMTILSIVTIIIVCILSFSTDGVSTTCDRMDYKKLERRMSNEESRMSNEESRMSNEESRMSNEESRMKEEIEVLKKSNEFMRNHKSIQEDILKIKRQENKEASDYIGGINGKAMATCRDSVSSYSTDVVTDTENPLPVELDDDSTYSTLLSHERLIGKRLSNSLKKLEFEIKNAIYVGCCINKIAESNGYRPTSMSMVDCDYFTYSGEIHTEYGRRPHVAFETQRELDGFFPF